MTTPTVPVTVNLSAMGGTALAGILVRAKLSANEVYGGFVLPQKVEAITDANGIAVLQCFPNAPSPVGLGSRSSVYSFTAAIPGGRGFNVSAQVPNRACTLHEIAAIAPMPSLETAQQGLLQAAEVYRSAAALALENNAAETLLADGTTVNWDMASGRVARLTLGASTPRTMADPSTLLRGSGYLILDQDATGGRVVTTWGTKWRFPSGAAPTLSLYPNSRDVFSYLCDGTNIYVSTVALGAAIAGAGAINPTAPAPSPAPAPTPAPQAPAVPTAQTIQAENGELEGTLYLEATFAGFQGTGYVAFFTSSTDRHTSRFPAVAAGTYDIVIGYARGGAANQNWVSINGATEVATTFATTTGYGTLTIAGVTLHAGTNTVAIRMKDGSFILDRVTISPTVSAPAPSPSPAPSPAPAPAITGGTGYAFGSRGQAIAVSHIKPTNVTTAQMDAAIKSCYDRWKAARIQQANYIVSGGYVDTYGGNVLYVSEGIGMAMAIVVAMAGYDANARALFDGLLSVSRARPAFAVVSAGQPLGQYLMNWRVGTGGAADFASGGGDGWAACDGDLDAAVACLMAHKQWGSTGAKNYLQEGRNTIAAIKAWFTYSDGRLQTRPIANMFRTSDVMLQHFQAFYDATGDSFWLTAKEVNLSKLEQFVASYSPTYNIIPDQLLNTNQTPPTSPQGAPDNLDNVDTSYLMYANAQRNPWRLGTAYLYESNVGQRARLKVLCDKWTNFIKADTQGYPERTATGYNVDGSLTSVRSVLFRPYTSGWYPWGMIGPQLCAAMADSSQQTYLNSLWAFNRDYFNTDYYNGELQLLPMLVASGNWWTP